MNLICIVFTSHERSLSGRCRISSSHRHAAPMVLCSPSSLGVLVGARRLLNVDFNLGILNLLPVDFDTGPHDVSRDHRANALGVPVRTMSPGSRVMTFEMSLRSLGIWNSIRLVESFWRTSLFTVR